METALAFFEQHSIYFSFIFAALCSFFFSLPTDLNPLSAFSLIFEEIGKKVKLPERSDGYKRLASLLAFSLIFFPIVLIISQLYLVVYKPFIIDFVVVYVLLSWHDKMQIYESISNNLQANNLAKAKLLLAQLTLRNTKPLSLLGIYKAMIESLVLRLANGWFGVIFWYLVSGIYGALFYQLLTICAQQWNCKLAQFNVLGQIPSVITTLLQMPVHLLLSFTFPLYDRPLTGIVTKFKQSADWHHFSSGLLLSSFALSIKTQLGGVRIYETDKISFTILGHTNTQDNTPDLQTLSLAAQRLSLSAWFWLLCITGYEFLPQLLDYFSGGYY